MDESRHQIWQDLNVAYEQKVKPNVEQVEQEVKQKIDDIQEDLQQELIKAGLHEGMREANRKRKHLYEMFLNKIKESPSLFIKLWTIPPLMFHISNCMFNSYVPVISFIVGCIFMLLLEAFLLFRVFDQQEQKQNQMTEQIDGELSEYGNDASHPQSMAQISGSRQQYTNTCYSSRNLPESPTIHTQQIHRQATHRSLNADRLQMNSMDPDVNDRIDLNVEVKYTQRHFEDPRDLHPDTAAEQERLYLDAQDQDIKRLFPKLPNMNAANANEGKPFYQFENLQNQPYQSFSYTQGQRDQMNKQRQQNKQALFKQGNAKEHNLSNETLYVQSQIMNFDEIQCLLMNQILTEDKKMMRMVDKAKVEEEQMIKGKSPLGAYDTDVEQDIMPEDEFDVEKVQNKFKLIKDTNQRFQEFVQNFQQNEKFLSQKFRHMQVDFGLQTESCEDDHLKVNLLNQKKKNRSSFLVVDQSNLPRQTSESRINLNKNRASVLPKDNRKPGYIKGDWVDVSNDESFESIRQSPSRSIEGKSQGKSSQKSQAPIEQFIHETGYKHQVIYLSCDSPILNQLISQRKDVEKEENSFIEQIKQLQKQQEVSQGKLIKYQKKTLEALQALVEQTKIYTKTKKEHDGDFKRILDSEIKYKMAFYTYADVKNKWMDRKLIDDDTKKMIQKTYKDMQDRLLTMTQDADKLFISIVQNMAKFFIYINTKETSNNNNNNIQPVQPTPGSHPSIQVANRVSDLTSKSDPEQRLSIFKSIKGSMKTSSGPGGENSKNSLRSINSNIFKSPLVFSDSSDLYQIRERKSIHQLNSNQQTYRSQRVAPGSVERQSQNQNFYPQYELRFEKEESTDLGTATQMKSQQQLQKEFEEMCKSQMQLCDTMEQKINCLEPISNFIMEVSLAFDEYLKNIISITYNEKGEEIIAYLADLEKEFRGQNERYFFSRFQRASLETQRRTSQNFKFITEIERLESLQAKIRQVVKLKLQNSLIVLNCKEHYIKYIDKLKQALKEGKRDFEKQIKHHNETMKGQFNKLKDHHIKLEYVRLMKQPQQKDLTQKKIKLMMENKSLIMLQFTNDKEMPSEESILAEISEHLDITNKVFKKYQKNCEQAQQILQYIEDNAQIELNSLQQRIIKEIQNIYQEIQASFQSYSKGLDQYETMYQVIQETENAEQQNITYDDVQQMDTSENLIAQRGSPEQIGPNNITSFKMSNFNQDIIEENQRSTFRSLFNPNYDQGAKNKIYSQSQLEKIQTEAFMNGKQHIVEGINHTLKIFWEVWRSSQPFKNELMKTIYLALNKNRPKFLSEVNVNGLKLQGPPPKIFDVRHVTRLLSDDPENEVFVDFSYQIQGPIIVTGDTVVFIDWGKKFRIPVFMKAIVNSLCAKMRVKFNTKDIDDNWIQWIGKPQAKISLEPIISESFDLKHSLPRVKKLIDDFMQQQLCPFEKIPIDIPLQDEPIFVARYSTFKNVNKPVSRDTSTRGRQEQPQVSRQNTLTVPQQQFNN